MAIETSGSCQKVCENIRQRLQKMKMLKLQEITHRPLFIALDECYLVRKADFESLRGACEAVVENWSQGDLAHAANLCQEAVLQTNDVAKQL